MASTIPTPHFFYGMQPGEETSIEIERGKTLFDENCAKCHGDTNSAWKAPVLASTGAPGISPMPASTTL